MLIICQNWTKILVKIGKQKLIYVKIEGSRLHLNLLINDIKVNLLIIFLVMYKQQVQR